MSDEFNGKISDRVVREIIIWIDNNLGGDLSIDAISRKSGYSKWHLQRVFKMRAGINLGGYVRERRALFAYYALTETDIPIIDIAFMLGFNSQQAFSRVIDKTFTLSPGVIRRLSRNGTVSFPALINNSYCSTTSMNPAMRVSVMEGMRKLLI
ncbi:MULTISPECIES: helix-turn-helix domain-containing protein [Serratia]|uniref:helix-turn-helix domain-containing protein n=1 Tax=Serratia TaxID=613 RepID=UPI0018D82392|nr:helix-turn-helix domain-containing protein [Serratia marcescens]HAT4519940.1 helix-turn-helix domain-containing protein [Serratia marcescens]HEJ8055917.1 helix-turn-helix domain-containing protein [Serratia marcescens]